MDPHRHLSRAIEDCHIPDHAPKDHDARSGDLAISVVNHEVVVAPQPQRPRGDACLPLHVWKGGRQVACLLLAEVIPHFDRERKHAQQCFGGIVLDELGSDLTRPGRDHELIF